MPGFPLTSAFTTAFSAMRTHALTGRDRRFIALVVYVLLCVPVETNLVSISSLDWFQAISGKDVRRPRVAFNNTRMFL